MLVIEQVVPAGDEPHPSKHMDLVMVSLLGGRERTETEYRALLGTAGFRVERVVPTPSPFIIIESVTPWRPVEERVSSAGHAEVAWTEPSLAGGDETRPPSVMGKLRHH
ncbi:methyltransferase [Streptomyces bungoensis]